MICWFDWGEGACPDCVQCSWWPRGQDSFIAVCCYKVLSICKTTTWKAAMHWGHCDSRLCQRSHFPRTEAFLPAQMFLKKNLNITSVSDLGRDWAFTWTCGRRLVPKISTLNSSLLRNAWRLQFCLGGFNHDQPISNAWICGSSYFSRFKDPWLFKYVQILFRQRVCANCQTVCDEAGSHLRRSETSICGICAVWCCNML